MVRLGPDHISFIRGSDGLLALLVSTASVIPSYRKLISEIVLLRLSILLENHLKIIYTKLACGAEYLDGSLPKLLLNHRSMSVALGAMKTINRSRARHPVWNSGSEIRENIVHLIDPTDLWAI